MRGVTRVLPAGEAGDESGSADCAATGVRGGMVDENTSWFSPPKCGRTIDLNGRAEQYGERKRPEPRQTYYFVCLMGSVSFGKRTIYRYSGRLRSPYCIDRKDN